MKTHLIIATSLDELRNRKEELVRKFSDAGNLKRHGDDSVETNDEQIFFLKVISSGELKTKIMQTIGRGYDRIDLDSILAELLALFNTLDSINTSEKPNENGVETDTEPLNAPETNDEEEDDVEVENEEEKDEENEDNE